MPAKIVDGTWKRRVPKEWCKGELWRTDIFKSTLSDPRLLRAEFFSDDGPSVVISADELRRVLEGGAEHYGGKIWGPFNIDLKNHTIDGHRVQMEIHG
jgi:hypothetical protein